jgi:beta-galactosidase
MMQVENEYAAYGNEKDYMVAIKDELINSGFDKVQLFRCDWSSNFNKYELDGVVTTLNFGAGSDIDKQFKTFQEIYPTAPLMCSEYWSGWFDHWGKPHETRSVASFIGSLKDMMDKKISFSLYMAHGGTTFGQWGGANAPPYSAMATSYDYNAPIGEQGNTTEKFFAVRDLLKNYLQDGEVLGPIPSDLPIITIPKFDLDENANIFDNLPKGKKTKDILSMEMFDQGWGRILYRTILPKSNRKQKLQITELHDWANIFINGKSIGKLDRRRGDNTIEIPMLIEQSQLDILVEATGRVNYGKAIIDRKGITEKVELINGTTITELKNWTVYNFPVEYEFQKKAKFVKETSRGPSWYKGTFNLTEIGDTFLDMSTWGKGMVWVNGYNIGRFWKIGPQQTLFMPGCWLKKGKNEIIVLDVDGPQEATIKGLKEPILDQLHQDESLLHRSKNQNLDLKAEISISSGSFIPGNGWQEVKFNQTYFGRYFCLEALNAQQAGDFLSAIAELELMNENGSPVSSLNWKIIYADSEEIISANQAADKIFDQQESTIWQTQTIGAKPNYPHQIVIDLGTETKLNGFRYLPRSDKSTKGMIKDYQIFFKSKPFKF